MALGDLVLIDRTAGTKIGDMTEGGGLAAAFDGVASAVAGSCARLSGTDAFVGKTLASAKVFGRAEVYGASNAGFASAVGTPDVTLTMMGKNGSAPSGPADGTVLGSLTFEDQADESAGRTIDSADLVNAWGHLWLRVQCGTSAYLNVAEVVLYEWEVSPASREGFHFVSADPTADLGADGDAALHTGTGTLWRKSAGFWSNTGFSMWKE